MGIIAFIILGLLAGIIAKAILPGDDPGGFIVTAIIGIVGALLGGFLAAALFGAHPLDEFFDISTWITAIVGSIILLLIYRARRQSRRPHAPHLATQPVSAGLDSTTPRPALTAAQTGERSRSSAVSFRDVSADGKSPRQDNPFETIARCVDYMPHLHPRAIGQSDELTLVW